MTAVTPTDRPKSVRNRCVIEVFGGVCVLSLVFEFSVGIGGFVIGLSQISFIFSLSDSQFQYTSSIINMMQVHCLAISEFPNG